MNHRGKKKLLGVMIAVAALAVSIGIAGCGQNSTSSVASGQTTDAAAQGSSPAGNSSQGQQFADRPSIFGKVKSIVGNEVEIQLAKMPKGPQGTQGGAQRKRSSGSTSGSGGQGGMPSGGFSGVRKAVSLELTGEVKTITIPVGVPIEQRSGQEIKQVDISDIYAGSTIRVWTDSKDKSMVTRVSVTAQTSSASSQ